MGCSACDADICGSLSLRRSRLKPDPIVARSRWVAALKGVATKERHSTTPRQEKDVESGAR
jgi:hypothetical protein